MKNVNKFVYDRTLTYLQKNRDYGNSVDKTRLILGEKADLVRMADKIHRIEQLTSLPSGSKPSPLKTSKQVLL